MLKTILLTLLALTLTACASSPYPLGMTQEQWQKLSAGERKAMLLKQQQYYEQQRLARIKTEGKQRELELALQLKEEERINKLYESPARGNVIMVNLLGGQYQYKKKVYQLQPSTLLLARGEIKQISLDMRDGKGNHSTERAYLKYNQEGTGLYLYLNSPSSYSRDYIAVLRDGRWDCGSKTSHSYAFNKYESFKGLKIFIKDKNGQCRGRYR